VKPTTAAHGISGLLVLLAVGAWLATGREGYTRWPDEKLEASDAPSSAAEEALLADIGFETEDDRAAQLDVESRFAFGLVPGGPDLPHLPSIAAAGALAIVISSATVARDAMRRRRQRADALASSSSEIKP
jgi:hypothetical protein